MIQPPLRLVHAHPLAQGGMGTVWLGEHAPTGRRLAVKALRGEVSPALRQRLQRETRALGRVRHPGVVRVWDLIDLVLPGHAVPTPSLVMDWVETGPPPPRTPAEVRLALDAVLEALAAAHARGVLHLDLKPSNVLHPAEGPPIRLIDFGLAPVDAGERTGGTPGYLAPEQMRTDAAYPVGAATDIHGAACLAWSWLTGAPPFAGSTVARRLEARWLESPDWDLLPPAEGLRAWFRKALAWSPWSRFADTTTARAALHAWWPADDAHAMPPPPTAGDTVPWTLSSSTFASSADAFPVPPPAHPPTPQAALPPPPLPLPWRRAALTDPGPVADPPLHGFGLGMASLPAQDVVGRAASRAALAEALDRVHTRGGSVAVALTGAQGSGRTHLLSWWATAARVQGATRVLETDAADGVGEDAWIRGWLRAALQGSAFGSAGDATACWDAWCEGAGVPGGAAAPWWAGALRRTLAGEGPVNLPVLCAAFAAWLEVWREGMVVLLAVDGTPRGEVPRALLGRDHPLRAMEGVCLGWAGDGGLPASAGWEEVPLAPLTFEETDALVRQLLGTTTALTTALYGRTQGQPAHVAALVERWIRQGRLYLTPTGFEAAPGDWLFDAADGDVWGGALDAEALERWRQQAGPAAWEGAGVAAVLGLQPDAAHLKAACDRLQAGPPEGWILPAEAGGWWRGGHASGHWASAQAREAVLAWGARDGRVALWAQAVLESQARAGVAPGVVDEVGWLLLAGREEEAVTRGLAAMGRRMSSAEIPVARALADRLRAVLQRRGEPADSPRLGALEAMEAMAQVHARHLGEAAAQLDALLAHGDQPAWAELMPRLLRLRATVAQGRGEGTLARALAAQAVVAAEAVGDTEEWLTSTAEVGWLQTAAGSFEEAAATLSAGLEAARRHGSRFHEVILLQRQARLERQRGRHEAARQCHEGVLAVTDPMENPLAWATALNGLAELEREAGALAEASAHYREAWTWYRRAASGQEVYAALNLALVDIARQAWTQAEAMAARTLEALVRADNHADAHCARAILAVPLAAQGRWAEVAALQQGLDGFFGRVELVDTDMARCLEAVALMAQAAGDDAAARAWGAEAVAQWVALQRPREAEALRARLGEGVD
jgi:tetratricopeptide (TPR) repeat protein